MIDWDAVIVPSDPIGQPSPAICCVRLMKHRVACFGKHHNNLAPMREASGTERIIADNTAVDSEQTATLR
jgi:hypothetical protein